MVYKPINYKEDYIGILDGLRGLMAFWVFYGNIKITCIGEFPIWGQPILAVDVFMFLSGFLMAYHWSLRQKKFEHVRYQIYDFYLRRFFRIAPLYYLLLTVAFCAQDYFFEAMHEVENIIPPPWAENMASFDSPTDSTLGPFNLLSHYTFLFGFFPQYVSNNILPDWSIGLEMQFYLIFPFLILFISRYGYFSVVLISIIITFTTNKFFGLYLSSGPLGNFPQPGMIFFKLSIFVSGICLAYSYLNRNNRKAVFLIILGAISLYSTALQVKIFVFIAIFLLFFDQERKDFLHRIVSGRFAKFLGDTSYGVYLLHLLIVYPFLAALFRYEWFVEINPYSRFLIALVVIGIPVYGISFLLFRVIELPGIIFGKKILTKLKLTKSHT